MSIQVTQLSILKLLEGKNILNSKYIQNCSIGTTPASKTKEHLLFQSPPSRVTGRETYYLALEILMHILLLSQISGRTPSCILNSQINEQLFNVLK